MRAFLNPAVERSDTFRGLFTEDDYRDVDAYFAANPDLAPSPLRSLPHLASLTGIHGIDAKDESERFGLNAFKIVGVLYAVHRLGDDDIRRGLVCATTGNHGRAVARAAQQKSVPSTIFIPRARHLTGAAQRIRTARVDAMKADGATVVETDGTYEEAVGQAARYARETGATILSDTSWDGYEQIPRWIMAGYTRIFDEAQLQWDSPPDVVVIQGGVGGLVCAAASWFAWRFGAARPFLIACEPENAACLFESARAGRPTHVEGDLDTIMAGLRCADPSIAAWPAIARGIDAFIAIDDDRVLAAMEVLSRAPGAGHIDAGPSGACGAASLVALGTAPELAGIRTACRLDRSTRALIVVTEGA
jgi:diaminopropionate ammonia-lyase